MGITSSLLDQQRLFYELKLHLDESIEKERQERLCGRGKSEDEGDESDVDSTCELTEQQVTYCKAKSIYAAWYRDVQLKKDVSFCELVEFEEALDAAFKTGKTPLILDSSPDDRVCTFFSYQPDAVILDAKSMVMASAAATSAIRTKGATTKAVNIDAMLGVMDSARKTLVNAMKFGKLLVIRLGTSAPDFVHAFSDDAMGLDTSKASSAYFPLLLFQQAGALLHDTKIDFGESRKQSIKQTLVSNDASILPPGNSSALIKTEDMTCTVGTGNTTTGKAIVAPSWAERLFREEDMRPHKNFAMCRDTFRVCVISQLPLEDIDEFLFGIIAGANVTTAAEVEDAMHTGSHYKVYETAGSLPRKDFFKIISIVPDAVESDDIQES